MCYIAVCTLKRAASAGAIALAFMLSTLGTGHTQAKPTVYTTTLEEPNQKTPEISTAALQQILADHSVPVLDVRSELEYAISHIPGAINLPEREADKIRELFPQGSSIVLTCNGPFCGKSKRVSADLGTAYNIQRYQLGLPVWRALGNTVQTDLLGFEYIFNRDKTAIFVDARPPQQRRSQTVACAVNIQPGEAEAANTDGRLPFWDKGARVVIFADTLELARQVATEVAHKAYWSSSYFSGTFDDLQNDPNLRIHSKWRCHKDNDNDGDD